MHHLLLSDSMLICTVYKFILYVYLSPNMSCSNIYRMKIQININLHPHIISVSEQKQLKKEEEIYDNMKI
jgi:hypothetical protein